MKGWTVRSLRTSGFIIIASMGTAGKRKIAGPLFVRPKRLLPGGSPIWQMFRVTLSGAQKALIWWVVSPCLPAIGRAAIKRVRRPVSDELIILRGEKMKKLKAIFRHCCDSRRSTPSTWLPSKMARIRQKSGLIGETRNRFELPAFPFI